MTIPNHTHPGWLEVSIDIHQIAHEALSAFLFDLGCRGIVTEDQAGHTFRAYLPFRKDLEDTRTRIDLFLRRLGNIFPDIPSPGLKIRVIEDEDWDRHWRRFFRPERLTAGLMVVPAWEPVPSNPDRRVIVIDPGPAFGTGQHPTTRMCLEAMEGTPDPGPWTMLDVGTGSGILAIYGAKLGADRVVAIDIDPEALRWAERNIMLNKLSGAIELSSKPLETWQDHFTLVVANLILGEILQLLPQFARVLHPGGWLILSGILEEQVKAAEKGLAKYGLRKDRTILEKEWACLVARKRV